MIIVGERLRSARLAAGLTQEAAAEQLGVSRTTWTRYEAGEIIPSVQRLVVLKKILNVSIDYLLGTDDSGRLSNELMELSVRMKQVASALEKEAEIRQ